MLLRETKLKQNHWKNSEIFWKYSRIVSGSLAYGPAVQLADIPLHNCNKTERACNLYPHFVNCGLLELTVYAVGVKSVRLTIADTSE